ncbi:mCG145149, partial [Mus musculus]
AQRGPRGPRTAQAIATAVGCPLELYGKNLLMRITCALGKGHRKMKLQLNFCLQERHHRKRQKGEIFLT